MLIHIHLFCLRDMVITKFSHSKHLNLPTNSETSINSFDNKISIFRYLPFV